MTLQVARPRLNPESMDRGFHAIQRVASTEPRVPACFYEPGDYSCVKDDRLVGAEERGSTLGEIERSRYLGYEELTEYLDNLANEFPDLLRVHSAGKSSEGREVWVATVTNRESGLDTNKPAVYLDGGMHPKEAVGTAFATHTIQSCLRNYGTDPLTTEILDSRALYVLPNIAPDGLEVVINDPTAHFVHERYDDPSISPADVDGDGRIRLMRVSAPEGEWVVSPKDRRLMVPRDQMEEGQASYRLFPEGFPSLSDKQPRSWPNMQVDLPGEWPPTKAGFSPRPFRDPATVAVADFFIEHPNICAALNYHAWGGVFMFPVGEDVSSRILGPRPLGSASYQVHPEDFATYGAIADLATSTTGYPSWLIDYSYSSFLLNWIWQAFGTFSASPEVVNSFKYGGPDIQDLGYISLATYAELQELAQLSWSDKELDGEGCVDWRPLEHPELGSVEIGGWNLQLVHMPPIEKLEDEMNALHEFVLKLASWTPLLAIHDVASERISHSHVIVQATVSNRGGLPTFLSQHALNLQLVEPVTVELKGASMRLSDARIDIGHLSGSRGTMVKPTLAPNSSMPLPRERKLQWLMELQPDVDYLTITASSDRAGTVEIRHRMGPKVEG